MCVCVSGSVSLEHASRAEPHVTQNSFVYSRARLDLVVTLQHRSGRCGPVYSSTVPHDFCNAEFQKLVT